MGKIRVHELAKELEINSKELVNKLQEIGMPVKNHMSTLEDAQVSKIREVWPGKKPVEPAKAEKPPAAPARPAREKKTEPTPPRREEKREPRPAEQRRPVERVGNPPAGTPKSQGGARGNQPRPSGEIKQIVKPHPSTQANQQPPARERGPQGQQRDNRGGRGYDRIVHPRPPGQPEDWRQNQPGDRRPPYQEGQRPSPQGDRRPAPQGGGQRPPYQGDRRPAPQGGQRPPYQGDRRPPYQEGQRPSPQGDRRPAPQGGGQRPPYQGDRRPAPQGGQRPPYQGDQRQNQGDRRPPAGGTSRFNNAPGRREQPGSSVKIPPAPVAAQPEGQRRDKPARPAERGQAIGKKKIEERDLAEKRLANVRNKKPGPGKDRPRVDEAPPQPRVVKILGPITVQELAELFKRTPAELIKRLMLLGVMATINQEVDTETAVIMGSEFGVNVEVEIPKTAEDLIEEVIDAPETLVERPPVVTVMGHVDHGKTSLLDAIRETNVTAKEAGGITQHIGAYQVEINNKKITFIDTPGHEAFTAMRARGANVTDIVILVVAADDGVMPQTIEAINHAKAAGVPLIVAVNKIDKPNANPDRVKQQLTEYALVPEEWGGETICVSVSAHTHENIDTLLEMILLVAEMGEIKANPNRPAKGTVIEAELDKGRGPVATILVQHGTLNIGDSILVGLTSGKVRAMVDDKGRRVKKAGPSTPVEVLGLNEVPMAGDVFQVVTDERLARMVTSERQTRKREEEMQKTSRVTLDDLFKQIKEGQVKELNIILKADVQGSIEALRQSLERLSTDEVRVNPIHGGVGAITESDVMLASASNAIIIGFNVRPDTNTRRAAENEQVDIRLYRVIYDAIEDVKAAMSGLLDPEYKEVVLGRAEVRATFKVPKAGIIAGSYVTEGKVTKTAEIRVIRNGIVIHEGKVDSLRRFKDDVKDVSAGYECGIGIEKFNDVKEGDILEAFTMEKVNRVL